MANPSRPWSPHPPAHYQEPSTESRGVVSVLASRAQAHSSPYYDPYSAQYGAWQPATQAPYPPGRQSSLPVDPYGHDPNGYPISHHYQPTDASVEALDLAQYHARLNAQQQYAQSQPQVYIPRAPQPGYFPHVAPDSSRSPVTHQSPVRDFIDVGPFTYSGIRETSPPPLRLPPVQPAGSPRRQQTRDPLNSPPPRSHLPWASENPNEYDLGDPDPVFPPSSPHRNDSNSFPFNVQSATPAADTPTSETAHSPIARNLGETSSSPDPEAQEKNWGVREGDRPGDIGADGRLISNGPRKRMALRALEVLTAIGACIACIYAFIVSTSALCDHLMG